MASDFVHLHLHTEFSLLDGACRIGEMLDAAVRLKMPAVAVTEHGNLFSAVAFHDQARKRGIKPILGCEVYVANGSRLTKSGTPGETANHLVLLAENKVGYHNLIKLVSAGYTEGFYYKPRIDKDLLAAHSTGLIGLSSCLKGEVATHLRRDEATQALNAAATFRDILGNENFFLEMQFQGIEEQRIVNKGLAPIARELGMPLVCTNDVHYLKQDDFRPHDVLLCIGTGKNVQDENRLRYHGDQFFLKTADEMRAVFGDFPEALENTVRIGERCDVDLGEGENHLPNFEVPNGFSLDGYFEHIVREGFKSRLRRLKELEARGALKHSLDAYEARLAYEIDVIRRMRYPGYFLIVWDFIRYARDHEIPVGPGRGSAAGSLVAYCLQITDVDPLEFDLIFERFLNPERVSLPDIDIDFCERRRGEVIEYVTRKYGRENVAQIITFGTMKARAAIRDVGRTLGMSYADVDRVAKQIPPTLDMTLDKAINQTPSLKEMIDKDERVGELVAVAKRLEGVTRHASVHAAGVVIAPKPITEFAPLYKSQKNEITTQWPMKEIERVGLLKMDFLGLSTLTLLDDAVTHIKDTTGEEVNLDRLPLDDEKTYRLFAEGQTLGVFQFESSGMRDTLRKARPKRFDDLIALNALYRPGPLRGGVIDDFIKRKHEEVAISYEVPALEPILEHTYGVIAYQEQVMRIASDLAGFSMGEADVLRKAMGKKDAAVMEAQRERFVEGATERGTPKKKAAKIFDLMEFFAGYGFNKSHSTTYAYLAFQTAYLKANFPMHFMAALLTIERQNTDKLSTYLGECRDMGVEIFPPDINVSDLYFTVVDGGIRFGLAAIKNVGESAIESIIKMRKAGEPVTSLNQLCENVDLRLANKRVLESLVKSGSFDSLYCEGADGLGVSEARARLLASLDRALDHGGRIQRDRERGQHELFGEDGATAESNVLSVLSKARPWTEAEQLTYEKESLGLYLSGHPVDRFSDALKEIGVHRIGDFTEGAPSAQIPGIISAKRALTTRKGKPMAVLTLEDRGGSMEAVLFPDVFSKFSSMLEVDSLVIAKGRLELDDESARLIVMEVRPMTSVVHERKRVMGVKICVPPHDRGTLEQLEELFSKHAGEDLVRLEMELRSGDDPVRLKTSVLRTTVNADDALAEEIERLVGTGSVCWD